MKARGGVTSSQRILRRIPVNSACFNTFHTKDLYEFYSTIKELSCSCRAQREPDFREDEWQESHLHARALPPLRASHGPCSGRHCLNWSCQLKQLVGNSIFTMLFDFPVRFSCKGHASAGCEDNGGFERSWRSESQIQAWRSHVNQGLWWLWWCLLLQICKYIHKRSILQDHIFLPALAGFSPMVALNDPRFGARFVSLHDAYDKPLRYC